MITRMTKNANPFCNSSILLFLGKYVAKNEQKLCMYVYFNKNANLLDIAWATR